MLNTSGEANLNNADKRTMKRYLYYAGILFLFSCTNGTSEKEEVFIRSRVALHNDVFRDFVRDSINKRKDIWDSAYYPGESKYKVQRLTDSIIATLYKNNNTPYNPDMDDHLTFGKFMTYCQQNKMDPVQSANKLRVK